MVRRKEVMRQLKLGAVLREFITNADDLVGDLWFITGGTLKETQFNHVDDERVDRRTIAWLLGNRYEPAQIMRINQVKRSSWEQFWRLKGVP